MTSLPRGWPPDKTYLSENFWTEHARTHCPVPPPRRYEQGPPSALVIPRTITQAGHPARGQMGLYAARNLAAGAFVLRYAGFVYTDAECPASSDYTMRLRPGLAIDADRAGNEARFINDYRGIGLKPNVELRDAVDARGNPAMAVHTLRAVAKGEELLLSYGKGFWTARTPAAE
eukprot:m.66465 g.66465  ORF g.66465 m.66465 type:complete len:174 (-) comp7403_c0_seq2:255-776(-)